MEVKSNRIASRSDGLHGVWDMTRLVCAAKRDNKSLQNNASCIEAVSADSKYFAKL
jgi:hypothetical protein